MAGHFFIVNGDLTKLACDAILIPTDANFKINHHWSKLLGQDRKEEIDGLRWNDQKVIPLRKQDRSPTVWLGNIGLPGEDADFVEFKSAIDEFVLRAAEPSSDGRIYPWPNVRLAVNLIGTDHGGASSRKGSLVRDLVSYFYELVRKAKPDLDLVLVTYGERPYAAAQRARHLIASDDDKIRTMWRFRSEPEGVDLVERARTLAAHATANRLVPFVGAGVSSGAGLPNWAGLLREAADHAKIDAETIKSLATRDVRDQATILQRCLQQQDQYQEHTFKRVIARLVERQHYALAHGLLASLHSAEAVTTNFDTLFEEAMRTAGRPLAVLPDESAHSERWLLKLHGTRTKPEKLVITRADYLDLRGPLGAFLGLLQGLLITRHILFVGYSLLDEDFHEVIHEVRLAQQDSLAFRSLGTVLTLREDRLVSDLWTEDLDVLPMTRSKPKVKDAVAARQLEIFLDLIAFLSTTSAAFFLDETYSELVEEETLRMSLEDLERDVQGAQPGTVADKVRKFLQTELGAKVDSQPLTARPPAD